MASTTEPAARAAGRLGPIPILPVGDAAVFAVFTLVGLMSHGDTFTPYHFLRNFIPLTVCWFLVALVLDTYGRGGGLRTAATLVVGVVAGVTVRTWWVGSPNGAQLWTFFAVALVTNGVLLLVWRLAAARLPARGRQRPSPP
jgi:Protein of unknown function (DUF3054)